MSNTGHLHIFQAGGRLGLILCMLTTLAACATNLPTIFDIAPDDYPPIDYYSWLKAADEAELASERQRLENLLGTESEQPRDRVQLALLLTAEEPSTPEDENRALELLDTVNNNANETNSGNAYQGFAALWHDILVKRLGQRTIQNQALQELREKQQELEEQIRALTSIEQQLMEREQSQGAQHEQQDR